MQTNKTDFTLSVELNYGIENDPSYNDQNYDLFIEGYLNDFNSIGIDIKNFPDNFALILSEAKEGSCQLSTLRAAWIKTSPTSSKLKIVKTFSPDQINEETRILSGAQIIHTPDDYYKTLKI